MVQVCVCERRIQSLHLKKKKSVSLFENACPTLKRGECGFESWVDLALSSCISLSIKWHVEPAGLQPRQMAGCEWRLKAKAPGRALELTMLFLSSSANSFLKEGLYSELFDFPIHYILPLKSLDHLHSYRAGLIGTVCGGGNPVGSENPLTLSYEVISSYLRLLIPPRKVYAFTLHFFLFSFFHLSSVLFKTGN